MTDRLTLADCFKYYKATIIYEQEKFFGIGDFFRCSNPTLNISDCKLILRTIEQLTDEERKHIVENFLCFQENYKTFSCGVEYLFNCSFNETTNYSVELADYLRKKNIMIENPNWFEIGKAVKE